MSSDVEITESDVASWSDAWRIGEGWELVHRHADALVREIPFEHLARLARGVELPPP